MVGPKAKRAAATKVVEEFSVSKAKACRVLGLNRSTFDYKGTQRDDSALRERMLELAAKHRRYGSPRIHWFLRKEGLVLNHKRTERIYSLLRLQLKEFCRIENNKRCGHCRNPLHRHRNSEKGRPSAKGLFKILDYRTLA